MCSESGGSLSDVPGVDSSFCTVPDVSSHLSVLPATSYVQDISITVNINVHIRAKALAVVAAKSVCRAVLVFFSFSIAVSPRRFGPLTE